MQLFFFLFFICPQGGDLRYIKGTEPKLYDYLFVSNEVYFYITVCMASSLCLESDKQPFTKQQIVIDGVSCSLVRGWKNTKIFIVQAHRLFGSGSRWWCKTITPCRLALVFVIPKYRRNGLQFDISIKHSLNLGICRTIHDVFAEMKRQYARRVITHTQHGKGSRNVG